jgi:hypothetical protein
LFGYRTCTLRVVGIAVHYLRLDVIPGTERRRVWFGWLTFLVSRSHFHFAFMPLPAPRRPVAFHTFFEYLGPSAARSPPFVVGLRLFAGSFTWPPWIFCVITLLQQFR